MYKTPIIMFGIVLPMTIAIAIIGACVVVNSKLNHSFEEKQRKYTTNDQNRKIAQAIEIQIGKQRPHIERWANDLNRETASAFSENLGKIRSELPAKEFQQTAPLNRENNQAGFGAISAQNSSRVSIGFRGSFRTVQKAFLELETRMPRLQLEQFDITPAAGPVPQLDFKVTYTSWEK
ncbi:hypothetical protein JIN85_09250 [Luteolibacter pohnpeiensis]|uniref:Uncharacterized protein n=1 Tax=Luteolibacter pohnpeiensis TaxID=454153 RepID=A0A934S865_9BACT|nr:hypothetical protein [Luteolibacter pohnpeiensis]MBK1882601.1 hypothetical protein [Luteolibacter pohnpeiensis]